jgi:hypothetical protein
MGGKSGGIYRRPKQMKLKENLYAQLGEFYYSDGTDFEGFYHLFDKKNKKYFEGGVYKWKARRIFPEQSFIFNDPNNIEYNQAKRAVKDDKFETKKTKAPIVFSPIITGKEIDKGEIVRFFVLRNNTREVFEVNEDQYKSYKKASNPYNLNYTIAKCSWFITGPLFTIYGPTNIPIQQGIYERNKQQAELLLDDVPNMRPIIQDLLQYTLPTADSNLHSDGTILYLPDGQPYVGLFHVHPTKGPMAGSNHTSATHPELKALL